MFTMNENFTSYCILLMYRGKPTYAALYYSGMIGDLISNITLDEKKISVEMLHTSISMFANLLAVGTNIGACTGFF